MQYNIYYRRLFLWNRNILVEFWRQRIAFTTETTLFHLAEHVFAPGSDNESGTKASKIGDRRGVRSNIDVIKTRLRNRQDHFLILMTHIRGIFPRLRNIARTTYEFSFRNTNLIFAINMGIIRFKTSGLIVKKKERSKDLWR